jgi:streptogramin lyase
MQSVSKLASLVAVAALCVSAAPANKPAAAPAMIPGVAQGVVKNATGQPVVGAYVKLTNTEKRLTILVVSQKQGRYTAPNLLPGTYTVQAIGGELQSKAGSVDVAGSKPAVADLSLTDQRAPALAPGWPGTPGTVGGAEVWNKMPPAVLPDGPGKEIAEEKCSQCHVTRWFLGFRGETRDEWAALIDSMRSNILGSQGRAHDLTPTEITELTDYFAANLMKPRPDSNSRLPRTLVQPDGIKYVAVDFIIPRVESEPHEMTVDAQGNQWVGERGGGRLGKFDPTTLTFTEFTPPVPEGGSTRNRLGAVIKGHDDQIWMVDAGPNHRWLEFHTQTSQFQSFPVPANIKGMGNGNTIRQHPDGSVWVASGGADGMVGLDPKTSKWVVYESPAGKKSGKSVGPYGFAIDGGGDIWFAEYANNGIGRLDPKTGEIDDFPVPIDGAIPRKVTADADGNIWVALHETGQLLKIDYKNPSNMKTFTPPSEHPGTYSPSGDLTNGYIWVSEQGVDKLTRFDPKTGTWAEFSVPYPETDIRRIEVDQTHPNRVWWSGTLSNHIGYIEVLDK